MTAPVRGHLVKIKTNAKRGKFEEAGILFYGRMLLKVYGIDCVNGEIPDDAEILRLMTTIPPHRISKQEQRMLQEWLTKFEPVIRRNLAAPVT